MILKINATAVRLKWGSRDRDLAGPDSAPPDTESLRRSHDRLVDTFADARAVARANDERVQVSIAAKRHLKVGQACDCKRLR